MFRAAIARSVRSASSQKVRGFSAIASSIGKSSILSSSRFTPVAFHISRSYSSAAGLAKPEVEGRIVDLLKNFDKVTDPSKLTPTSHFSNDLGLDSLDTVEVVMAIEEEFSIEIPDKDADAIHSGGLYFYSTDVRLSTKKEQLAKPLNIFSPSQMLLHEVVGGDGM